jgi:hypothetical protein
MLYYVRYHAEILYASVFLNRNFKQTNKQTCRSSYRSDTGMMESRKMTWAEHIAQTGDQKYYQGADIGE